MFLVKENKESALEAQNQLREEILGKLEDTNKNIDQVQTRILTNDQVEEMRKDLNSRLQVSGNLVSGLDEVTSKSTKRAWDA